MKILILLSALALMYCSEKSTQPVNDDNLSLDHFSTPGNRWIYAYCDSLSSTEDTVTVTVLGSLNQSDTSLWEYSFSTHTDTQYVWVQNDTVTFASVTSQQMREMILVFPLEIGNGWKGHYATDTFSVVAQDTIIVHGVEFKNSWLIEENWGALNDYGRIKIWFDPSVGMLYKHHVGWSFGTANNTSKLLSYSIKK